MTGKAPSRENEEEEEGEEEKGGVQEPNAVAQRFSEKTAHAETSVADLQTTQPDATTLYAQEAYSLAEANPTPDSHLTAKHVQLSKAKNGPALLGSSTPTSNDSLKGPTRSISEGTKSPENQSRLGDSLRICQVEAQKLFDSVDSYFESDRNAAINRIIRCVKNMVETLLLQDDQFSAATSGFRAEVYLLLGRVLDAVEAYIPEAEETLSKAVKLNPRLRDGWNSLGSVYWKKGAHAEARQCFEEAIETCGPCSSSLRGLSMTLRSFPGCEAESVRKAKEAVAMDVNDRLSWYVLANAYLTDVGGGSGNAWEKRIAKALTAYNKAEELCIAQKRPYPDIHVNRAEAFRFMELYGKALLDLDRGHALDPDSGCLGKARSMRKLLTKIAGSVQNQYRIRPKKLASLLGELNTAAMEYSEKDSQKAATGGLYFGHLKYGENPSRTLIAKLLTVHSPPSDTPVLLGCVSGDGVFFCAAVYDVAAEWLMQRLTPMVDVLVLDGMRLKKVDLNDDVELANQDVTFWSVAVSAMEGLYLLKDNALQRIRYTQSDAAGFPCLPTVEDVQ